MTTLKSINTRIEDALLLERGTPSTALRWARIQTQHSNYKGATGFAPRVGPVSATFQLGDTDLRTATQSALLLDAWAFKALGAATVATDYQVTWPEPADTTEWGRLLEEAFAALGQTITIPLQAVPATLAGWRNTSWRIAQYFERALLREPTAATGVRSLDVGLGEHLTSNRVQSTSSLGLLEQCGVQRELCFLGEPVLRQRAASVTIIDDSVRQLVADLLRTMRDAQGVGLAANQIRVPLRVAVVDVGDDDPPPIVMINPVIIRKSSEMQTAEEGCLSIPGIFADVERPDRVLVEALDQDGEVYRIQAQGYKARAIQHEIDHLDGIVFLDRLSTIKRGFLLKKWKKTQEKRSSKRRD